MAEYIDRQYAIAALQKLEDDDIDTYGCLIQEGFHADNAIKAIKALPAADVHEMQWMPVSDKLPGYDIDVLCTLSSGDVMVCHRDDYWGKDIWVDGGFGTGSFDVIAWLPLPEPYKM